MKVSGLENADSRPLFRRAILTGKLHQTDHVFLTCNQGSLIGLCMQDYKSLCAAVAICSTLVNLQTDTFTHTNRIWPAYLISSASWAKNQNNCHSGILSRINPIFNQFFSITVIHNLTRFHENRMKTFGTILFIDKQTDPKANLENITIR